MRLFSSVCALTFLVMTLQESDLAASDKVIHRLDEPAPLGLPRILPDNRTCLFFEGIFKSRRKLVSLELATGQTTVFQRDADDIVHADELDYDQKDCTSGEYVDISPGATVEGGPTSE